LLAPQELRTADPSFATELYNGHFGLAGKLAEVDTESPFEIDPPSEGWARELYGFGWLRHLRAAGSELSREQAKVLVNDFIALKRSLPGLAWQPEIVGRRVISWLSNSVLVLDTGEPQAYETFLRALSSQLRYLSASYRDAPDGVPRLVSLMALVYAGLCIAEQQAVVDRYTRPLCKELERQILPDGGHISRNPEALVELLLDLLPLKQCFVARDRPPPKPTQSSASCPCSASSGPATARSRASTAQAPRRPTRLPPCSPMTTSRARRCATLRTPPMHGSNAARHCSSATSARRLRPRSA
jgi:uncharacterized heparinase superfamily protein